jgi:hypothetical protein
MSSGTFRTKMTVAAIAVATAIVFPLSMLASARSTVEPPKRLTTEKAIARAGMIALTDLPSGWKQESSNTKGSGNADQGDIAPDSAGALAALATRLPECRTFVMRIGAGEQEVGAATGSPANGYEPQWSATGPQFRQGPAKVMSEVSLYATPAAARGFLDLIGTPSTKSCLAAVYRSVAAEELKSGLASLPGAQRKAFEHLKVKASTPRGSSVGDGHVLFEISVDLNPVVDVQIVVDLEYVRVGRAVGMYAFSGVDGVTPREQVLPVVAARLAAAQ